MDTEVPRLRAFGIDPAIINMGIALVEFLGYRRDVRLVEAAEQLHGKGCKEIQGIPCDVPHINLISSEHWDVRSGLGSLAQYSNPKLKESLETKASSSRKAEYTFQVLSPNIYLHKYNTTPSHRDTAARMIGEHPMVHELYLSLSGNMELPAVLAENQQDQIKNGKFDYRAPVYNVCNAMLSAVRGIDAYRGTYGRVILNHSKKWGIDRKSPSSDLNKTEYGDRKNAAEREMFNLLAANGLTEWIETLQMFERSGYKLDDRADALLICVHYLADLYDSFYIRDGVKHKDAIDVRTGFTRIPSVLLNPLGLTAPKKPRKTRTPRKKTVVSTPTKEEQRAKNAARTTAFEKHLRDRKREREGEDMTLPSPRPTKRTKKAPPVIQEIIDMTNEDDGYISDTFVDRNGISYEELMDVVAKSKVVVPTKRRRRTKSIFLGVLDVQQGSTIRDNHPTQSKIDRFFTKRDMDEKEKLA